SDLTELTNRVNTFNTHVCDSVKDCVTSWIHDSIANISGISDLTELTNRVNTFNTHVCDSVKDCVTGWIHDSIANIADNISEQIHDSLTNALNDYTIQNCDDVNDCVSTAIADGNSVINHAIDTVVLNNVGEAIADGNSEINHAIDTVVLNNIGDAIADGNSDINHAIDTIVNNIAGSAIHDSLTNALNNLEIRNCDDVNDCVSTAIADGNSVINHAIDTVVINNVSGAIADGNSEINHAIDTIVNNIAGSAIHDTLTNNHYVTETVMGNAIHDSISDINSDLTELTNRVNTFNTHICDSVENCIKEYLNANHYVTETVMGNAIHDSIAHISGISDLTELTNRVNTFNTHVCDSVKDCVTSWIHDSIANISGISDLTALTERVNTFNTHVCDSVKDCVTGWIHDSIANISGISDLTALTERVNTFNTHVCDSVKDCVTGWIHDSIANIADNIGEQIHDSISNYLTNDHYVTESSLCTTIETNCNNVALRNGNTFTGDQDFRSANSVTVPDAISPDLPTVLAAPCTQEAVNLCDLLVVFDSLSRRINSVFDSLQRLKDELTALKSAITANAPTVSNVTSTSMNVKANATSVEPITSYEICISTNSDMSSATCQTVQASDADNYTFTGLAPKTDYYVQYTATNAYGSATSPIVQQRTLTQAPTADVSNPIAVNPTGFSVAVDDVDAKQSPEATVEVCYVQKGAGDCPAEESSSYNTCINSVVVATGGDTVISQFGLVAETEYCVIVKVSNEDSTTIYGPYTVTTGAEPSISITGGGSMYLCNDTVKPVFYTATISDDDASNYTFAWSAGASTTDKDTVSYNAAGTYPVTVTATRTNPSYTLTATTSVTLNAGGTLATLVLCEDPGNNKVNVVDNNCTSLSWKNSSDVEVSTAMDSLVMSSAIPAGVYTVTGMSVDGCSITRRAILGNYSPNPCIAGSHPAQTGDEYKNNGYNNAADHGLETTDTDGNIISVTDYDGNEYTVVQIGSQCWMTENLRCTHSPKTGTDIVVVATGNASYSNKMAAWYNNDQATYDPKRYGLLYNWCAAMDTANPTNYQEVMTGKNNNTFNFTHADIHQGICPTGWHIPSDAEWNEMATVTGASTPGGAVALSYGCDWDVSILDDPNRNASGFSAVPSGWYHNGSYADAGVEATYWSSTDESGSDQNNLVWHYRTEDMTMYQAAYHKHSGYSVRCVRDAVLLSVTRTGGDTVKMCGASSVDVTFTVTPSNSDSYTYNWSGTPTSTSGNTATYSFTSAGTYTVTVTATNTTEGYTMDATKSVTLSNNPVVIGLCETDGIVTVKDVSGNPNHLEWGDGGIINGSITTSTGPHNYAALGTGSHNVTITASSADGCTFSRTMTVTIASTVADRTVKPCTIDPASHAAQIGSAYIGNGHGSANYGLETVNGSGQVTSVTDYDGNAYPVVQIGSQCWMAENLRCTHSPKTGSYIVVNAVSNTLSKMAAWYNNEQSTYEAKRYGLLYNWCAAMDTAKSGSPEVATSSANNDFDFQPASFPHQGVCPVGWHVPTDVEWSAMELEVNGTDVSGTTGYRGTHAGKLSTGCDWTSSNTANAAGNYANAERNSSGFSALPAGNFSGSFSGEGDNAYFWSSTRNNKQKADSRELNQNNSGVNRDTGNYLKSNGASVRCVRD
ncbi:MAG: PKD domain-containing protein, partial [Bacteroidales bacterium]|nr:PKD domain-containing protein [Bacteroidales bacterium]